MDPDTGALQITVASDHETESTSTVHRAQPSNLLLMKCDTANTDELINAVETELKFNPSLAGDQAGLFWYGDDDNYVKFVVSHTDGSVQYVLSVVVGGTEQPAMATVPLRENELTSDLILRLERKEGVTLTACVVHPRGKYCGTCCSVVCLGC